MLLFFHILFTKYIFCNILEEYINILVSYLHCFGDNITGRRKDVVMPREALRNVVYDLGKIRCDIIDIENKLSSVTQSDKILE
jgi:hypothetical protein